MERGRLMDVQSLKRFSSEIQKQIHGRKAMFIPVVSVLSFFVVGYTALDKEAPVISTSEIKLDYGEQFDVSQIIISDNHDELNDLIVNADTSLLNSYRLGDYKVPVTVSDRCKNEVTKDILVHVVDEVKPEFKIKDDNENMINNHGVIKVNVNASNDLSNYITAFDNVDGDISLFMDVIEPLDTSKLGSQSVKVGVKDSSGNYNETSYLFVVSDVEAPTISWKNSNEVTVDYGTTFDIKDFADIHDNSTGDEDLQIEFSSAIDTTTIGKYESTITVSDLSNNKTEEKIIVEVKDISAPVIMVSQDAFEIEAGNSFDIRSYVSVLDNLDGDITDLVEVRESVNTNVAGDYSLMLYVKDEAGNEASKTISVTVTQPYQAPVYSSSGGNGSIVSNGLSKVGCAYSYGSSGPYAFDCSGFTSYVYAQSGINIGRTTYAQYSGGTHVTDIQPGDLLFFNTVGSIGHVGIYIGNGQMVHAGSSATGVEVTSINSSYWQATYAGAVRY